MLFGGGLGAVSISMAWDGCAGGGCVEGNMPSIRFMLSSASDRSVSVAAAAT